MKLGYCPTMEEFVKKNYSDKNFELINLGSAKKVLFEINNNQIELGVIGRVSKNQEFNGFVKRVDDGYTLITKQKVMIHNSELKNLEIHTDISKNIVEKKYPELKNIYFDKTLNKTLNTGDVQLISWNDWNDSFELLIPVDNYHNKNKKFRTPHIYSKNKDLI